MYARWALPLVTLALCLCVGGSVVASDVDNDYRKALTIYYNVSEDVIAELTAAQLKMEDIPVAVQIHQKTRLSCQTIAERRARGDTWMEIASAQGMRPQDFYVIVVGKISSKTYGPIFDKFKTRPIDQWGKIELTDSDIVNLVNLKFIASQHDYSIFRAMELRDRGKDFVRINHEVRILKAELIRSQKKARDAQTAGDSKG
ncbi:MAG TPA: hypothetical protein VM118_10585 [Acidobacteriota bacterium]|nr:hypothetical protein [Acidobacteriota bacterium]